MEFDGDDTAGTPEHNLHVDALTEREKQWEGRLRPSQPNGFPTTDSDWLPGTGSTNIIAGSPRSVSASSLSDRFLWYLRRWLSNFREPLSGEDWYPIQRGQVPPWRFPNG